MFLDCLSLCVLGPWLCFCVKHMLACAALRYKVGLVYHGNAAETGEYLYDPNYTPTRDIEQVVHTLSAINVQTDLCRA